MGLLDDFEHIKKMLKIKVTTDRDINPIGQVDNNGFHVKGIVLDIMVMNLDRSERF